MLSEFEFLLSGRAPRGYRTVTMIVGDMRFEQDITLYPLRRPASKIGAPRRLARDVWKPR